MEVFYLVKHKAVVKMVCVLPSPCLESQSLSSEEFLLLPFLLTEFLADMLRITPVFLIFGG